MGSHGCVARNFLIDVSVCIYRERNWGITGQSQTENETVSRREQELRNMFGQSPSRPVINACRNRVADSSLALFSSDWEFARELEEAESVGQGAQPQRATRGVDWPVLQPSSRQALQD